VRFCSRRKTVNRPDQRDACADGAQLSSKKNKPGLLSATYSLWQYAVKTRSRRKKILCPDRQEDDEQRQMNEPHFDTRTGAAMPAHGFGAK
jgi:hypothetical protein